MELEKLITKQQLKIQELEEKLELYDKDFETIWAMLYGVGAPLNDNILNFNKEQLEWFFSLSSIVKIP